MEISKAKDEIQAEDDGVVVHIEDISGEPQFEPPGEKDGKPIGKPVTIKVAGSYSKRFRRAQENQRKKDRKRPPSMLTEEEQRRRDVAVAAACVLEWDGFTQDGKPFPFSEKNAIELFVAMPWVYGQILMEMNDHSGFSTARSAD